MIIIITYYCHRCIALEKCSQCVCCRPVGAAAAAVAALFWHCVNRIFSIPFVFVFACTAAAAAARAIVVAG